MQTKIQPAIFLLLASPVLAELLSASSPATMFFQPIYFLLQVVSYGIPALIIRELSVRWKLGLRGIFTMGLAYGIFNEGLLSHTFFQVSSLLAVGYGFHFGLALAWIPYISIWHALHSILYPILLTYFIYPKVASEPWLGRRLFITFVTIVCLESFVLYFAPHRFPATLFVLFWFAIFLLFVLARRWPGIIEKRPVTSHWAIVVTGFLSVLGSIAMIITAKAKVPLLIFWIILFLLAYWVIRLLRKRGWLSMPALVLFACGDYILWAVFAGVITGSPVVIATSLVFVLIFLKLVGMRSWFNGYVIQP
jgi:hypothetical protein